jgi:hypothetical protein
MFTKSQLERPSAAAESACLCEQTTGLPAEITVAQWAIESGWGATAPDNNCFGIKAYPACSESPGVHDIGPESRMAAISRRNRLRFGEAKTTTFHSPRSDEFPSGSSFLKT